MSDHEKKCDCDLSGIPPVTKVVEADSRTAYIDGTDFLYELGADGNNHVISPTVEKLKEYEDHEMGECGIAEVKVTFVRWVKEPK